MTLGTNTQAADASGCNLAVPEGINRSICSSPLAVLNLAQVKISVCIANQFRHASAAIFAEGRGATTSPVSKHVARSENFQAEACPD